tara:strand:+ start:642 stop:827 length:186 start_codon:yes stop_codon:yes gene_type:complete
MTNKPKLITSRIFPEPIGDWKFQSLQWSQYDRHPIFFHKFMAKIFFGMTYIKRQIKEENEK